MTIPRLQLTGITKAYPGVVANSDVSLTMAENVWLGLTRSSVLRTEERKRNNAVAF